MFHSIDSCVPLICADMFHWYSTVICGGPFTTYFLLVLNKLSFHNIWYRYMLWCSYLFHLNIKMRSEVLLESIIVHVNSKDKFFSFLEVFRNSQQIYVFLRSLKGHCKVMKAKLFQNLPRIRCTKNRQTCT